MIMLREKSSLWTCPLTPTFFGLGPNYRPILHQQIFDLIYWGKGGFTWSDVYAMPVWLRVFYIKSIEKVHKERNKQEEAASKKAKAGQRRRR
tara:strand:- start:352 stop:627 length:276 start_codon:yes stop_codon:yes gene_type:complete